ncbi:MAG: hypothetical protein LBO76_05605 [Treponema sp.]|jgi:hypothetical protein|nr:hypothetical protein [Treponema sp.]
MSLFCLLWPPLFYLFWRSVSPAGESGYGGVWALLLGSVAANFQFFYGAFVRPGGFGFSRWLSGCVDLVAVPVLLPLLVCLAMTVFRMIAGTVDFTGFALLWIIPMGALRAVNWGARGDPVLLVLVPLLWTAIAAGLPFLGGVVLRGPWPARILAGLAALALPPLAATVYWAFFRQEHSLGFPLLALSVAPLAASCVCGAWARR